MIRWPWMIQYGIVVQIVWAVGSVIWPKTAENSTSLHYLISPFPSPQVAALVLLASALAAQIALGWDQKGKCGDWPSVLLLPQALFMAFQGLSALVAVFTNEIPNFGQASRPAALYFSAAPVWIGTLLHYAAILDMHGLGRDFWTHNSLLRRFRH